MGKISVTIITYNEEKNIERCLKSLQGLADEIIVVDSFSTDKTIEICEKYKVKLFQNPFDGYSAQKNFAISKASFDIILSLDADEALSGKLKELINKIKLTISKEKAYTVNRLTNYCGKWIKHSGWYPDTKLRLWFKNEGKWQGGLHEKVVFKKPVEIINLKGDLLHYSYHSISQHIQQIDKFTDLGANESYKKNIKANVCTIIIKTKWKFIRDYFFKLGFLDGYYGFIICFLSAQATFIKYIKLRELYKLQKNKWI